MGIEPYSMPRLSWNDDTSKGGNFTVCPKRRALMQSPLNIVQFNALLHSKKDQTELISALQGLTSADIEEFAEPEALFLFFW
jgi:hypothetical protein